MARHMTAWPVVLLVSACSTPATPAATPSPVQFVGALNPAVTQATIETTVCRSGWTATVRPPATYTNILKRRQLPKGADPKAYEEDHLIPLSLGGAPKDPANLRPVPLDRAKKDDVVETRLHKQLCAGTITLAAARLAISQVKAGE
jgi:hypothetical protein